MQSIHECRHELRIDGCTGEEKEDDGGDELDSHLLAEEREERCSVPAKRCLVGKETADEEEERHAEEHEKRHGGGEFDVLLEAHQGHMVCNDKDHCESAHGIKPLQTLLAYRNFTG